MLHACLLSYVLASPLLFHRCYSQACVFPLPTNLHIITTRAPTRLCARFLYPVTIIQLHTTDCCFTLRLPCRPWSLVSTISITSTTRIIACPYRNHSSVWHNRFFVPQSLVHPRPSCIITPCALCMELCSCLAAAAKRSTGRGWAATNPVGCSRSTTAAHSNPGARSAPSSTGLHVANRCSGHTASRGVAIRACSEGEPCRTLGGYKPTAVAYTLCTACATHRCRKLSDALTARHG